MFISCIIYSWSICTNATSTAARIQFANVKIFSWNCPLLRLWCKYSLVVCFNDIAFFLMETISEYQKLGVINFVLTLYKKLLFLNIYLIKRIGFFKIILILTQYFGQINILQSFECTKLILYRGFVSAESCTSVVIAVFKWQCSRLSKLESFLKNLMYIESVFMCNATRLALQKIVM